MYKLDEFANGKLNELVNKAIKQVFDNIADRETPSEKPRKVLVTLTFEADEFREDATVGIDVKTKLVPKVIPSEYTAVKVNVSTRKNVAPVGQMSIDDFKESVESDENGVN